MISKLLKKKTLQLWLPAPLWGSERFSKTYTTTPGVTQRRIAVTCVKVTETGGNLTNADMEMCLTAVSLGSWIFFLPSHQWVRRRTGGSCLKGWRRGCYCLPGQQGASWDDPPVPERKPDHQSRFLPMVQEPGVRMRKPCKSEKTEGLMVKSEDLCLWYYMVFHNKTPDY